MEGVLVTRNGTEPLSLSKWVTPSGAEYGKTTTLRLQPNGSTQKSVSLKSV